MGGLHHPKYTETAFMGACKQPRDHDGIVKKLDLRTCELCGAAARVYCSADEAQLCLACDFKVHSANFLVSKHSRDVVCASCGAISRLALTGPRIECQMQQQCMQRAGRCCGGGDEEVSGPLSSVESCNSSCCTQDDREALLPLSAPRSKKRGVSLLEEGCGDSEEYWQSSPCSSKRKRLGATRGRSHARRNRGLRPKERVTP